MPDLFGLIFLPLMIFLARVCDVTIGTIRIITLSRGHKLTTAVLGFFELLIWLLAIGQVFQNINNMTYFLAYAGGFAVGNYVGMVIEEKIALGRVLLTVNTQKDAQPLLEALKERNYGYVSFLGEGARGEVRSLSLVIKRKSLTDVCAIIEKHNPKAFYSVSDVRSVSEGIFPIQESRRPFSGLKRLRKGK